MKNKGRKHKYPSNGSNKFPMAGIGNCKGTISHLTRLIESMSSKGMATGRFDKKKWSKRVRGYLKSQTKDID